MDSLKTLLSKLLAHLISKNVLSQDNSRPDKGRIQKISSISSAKKHTLWVLTGNALPRQGNSGENPQAMF